MVILLGDFNGHVGFTGPQPLNYNGRWVLDIMGKMEYDTIKWWFEVNGEEEVTRRQGNIGSAIDFISVNEALYKYFETMFIDEDKGIFYFVWSLFTWISI